MLQDFKPGAEEFRGQRWLTTLLLLVFAAAMVAAGIKGLASGDFTTAAKPNQPAGIIPVRLAIPGQHFEAALAAVSPKQAGSTGWVETSANPGEAGTAVIAVSREWPVANLQPGDRLEITGQSGQKLVYEITGSANRAVSLVNAVPGAATSELKLVVIEPNGQESLVITARPVATN